MARRAVTRALSSADVRALRVLCALAGCLAAVRGAAAAQTAAAPDTGAVPLTYAVPESPAFTFLGIAPAKVGRASSPRDLGAALVNAIDSTGRVRTGVALGATLWTLLPDVRIDLERYRRSRRAYALANTTLALGTARASGDSADTDVAFGVRTTLFDASDPMRDSAFTTALTRALAGCLRDIDQPAIPVATPGSVSADDPCAGGANDTLRLRWFQTHWNRPALSLGAGAGWRVPRSEVGSLDPRGVSAWLVGGYPLGASGQLLGQLQYDHRNGRDARPSTGVLTYGARVVRGTKAYNYFLEVAGTGRVKSAPELSRSNVQWSGGVELELASDYWLSAGFGKRYTAQGQPDRVVLVANVRWGIASRSRLRMLPARAPGP